MRVHMSQFCHKRDQRDSVIRNSRLVESLVGIPIPIPMFMRTRQVVRVLGASCSTSSMTHMWNPRSLNEKTDVTTVYSEYAVPDTNACA